uniref:15-hydroxyprostaglandin dehydrogenase [NAD(+)] n=2 Tax=Lutzomyia longipalpis TaxID=7200 RepID=A0A1B0CAT8_LUTLO
MVEVNLCGTITTTLLAMEHMRVDKGKGNGGVVVNISSTAGIYQTSSLPTYSATKHAIVVFTRSLAYGRENKGIRFLTLCPGGTMTPLLLSVKIFQMKTLALLKMWKNFKVQSSKSVAKAVVKIIENGQNGSVWIVKNDKLDEHIGPPILH